MRHDRLPYLLLQVWSFFVVAQSVLSSRRKVPAEESLCVSMMRGAQSVFYVG